MPLELHMKQLCMLQLLPPAEATLLLHMSENLKE